MANWHVMSLDSSLDALSSVPTPAPVIGKLVELPFTSLTWENFERLQLRVMRDVEGLRDAQIYGDRGQAQRGLDIVALAPDGSGVALQSKNYKRFYASDLVAAVQTFRSTTRPFNVDRLVIGVACSVKSTGVVEELAEQSKSLHPIVLQLWDAQELSLLLRNRAEIVIEFFGMPTAKAFCLPFKIDVALVPSADAAGVREAIARTPEVSTGAQKSFDAAARTANREEALALIEEGQKTLRDRGFGPHAASHEQARMRLLAEVGRADEAARHVLDDFWAALDQGLSVTAEMTRSRLGELSVLAAGNEKVAVYRQVMEAAIHLYLNPLGQVPAVDTLRLGDPSDQARLILLAGETALAGDMTEWLKMAIPVFSEFSVSGTLAVVQRTRLRLLIAEAKGDWTELLTDARKLVLGYALSGLVTARYARALAYQERFEEADFAWDESSGWASLAGQWGEAATWIFSRRAFRSRWSPFTSNELLPLQVAVSTMGTSVPIVPTSANAYENALSALSDGKLRSAAISAQRALRDAVTTGDWVGEERSRRVLASVLIQSDESALAGRHLVRAGATTAIEMLGQSMTHEFVDIVEDLGASNYWTVGATFRLIAVQSDLVPDALIAQIAECICDELHASEKGSRPDLRSLSTSRYNNAVRALAGIATRTDVATAEIALSHFERQPTIDENHYRYHDEYEATTVAKIAISHPSLASRAIAHLVPLLGRAQGARSAAARDAIDANQPLAHDALTGLANAGNSWAQETLAFYDTADVQPAVAEAALARLTTPLSHVVGMYSVGTNAIGDSLLIANMLPKSIDAAVSQLMVRATDPQVGSSDRGEYMVAATNLVEGLEDAQRQAYFSTAMQLADFPTESEHDELNQRFAHKLGGFRVTGVPLGSRGQALALAASLATNATQRNNVRRAVYSMLGDNADYWPTIALERLGDTVKDDLAFLGNQGWAIRSLAASLWVEHGEPPQLGKRLAQDPDVRVRRSLARALARQSQGSHDDIRDKLGADPAHSVRAAVSAVRQS